MFLLAFIAVASVSATVVWAAEPKNISRPVKRGGLPVRVHVFEDYETEIERRWWLRGEVDEKEAPKSLSASVANRRSCRATATKDFDDKQGDPLKQYKGVIFNPVPGPPMSGATRLSFRYQLQGTDTLRVQIYSLTNNYHRCLTLTGLKQNEWQEATVDMTQARRPDGSGGPLSADERIDDIQFYVEPAAELWIDDIVLFEAARKDEREAFLRRVIFTGWFDTGKQGAGHEWPGVFEIVAHERPRTWKAARSVARQDGDQAQLVVNMRGRRPLSAKNRLRFDYHLTGGPLVVALVDNKTGQRSSKTLGGLKQNEWARTAVDFEVTDDRKANEPPVADEIHFDSLHLGAVLTIDDVLLYEPANR
jgi:hypothetical protein